MMVRLEKHLERSLCQFPELIDPSLYGIRQGMEALGPDVPTLKKQDRMPNGTIADMVFVETKRITIVEIKKIALKVRKTPNSPPDVVDQIIGYIEQCRLKYPDRNIYRGIIIGTSLSDQDSLFQRLFEVDENVSALIFGRDIPAMVKLCFCGRALDYDATSCNCGARY